MKKQIIHSLLLVIFFNYIMGCSLSQVDLKKVTEISGDESIDSAVLTNMQVISFNSDGGRLHQKTFLEAALENDKPFMIKKEQIKYYRVSKPESFSISEIGDKPIKEAQLTNNMYVIFDRNGGRIEEDKFLSGRSNEGIEFKIKLEKVSRVYSEFGEFATENEIINKEKKLTQIISHGNNYIYNLNNDSIKFNERNVISGITSDKNYFFETPVDSVLYVNIKKYNTAQTTLALLGTTILIVAAIAIIAIAAKESCPFIYSFDGNKYVLDAEPLGGATSFGLARTDYSRLEYLKQQDNFAKILVRNEVEETQYIDELGIIAVNHDEDKKVYPDLNGNFYQVKNLQMPSKAVNEKNQDLLKLVSYEDNYHWETKLPIDKNELNGSQRHEIKIVFPKLKDQKSVKLVANIGTSLWGSRMIKEMLQLYGNNVDLYYNKINELGIEYKQMMNFIENEELYKLKYYIFNGETWDYQGFINGGGPFVAETRIYDLDISNVKGDSIQIKFNPPYGFWTIDYLALDYEDNSKPQIQPLEFVKAINDDGKNVTVNLISQDKIFYVMPKVGDSFEAYYKLDKEMTNEATTYYLKSHGYYEIHLDKTIEPQFAILMKMNAEKGYIVKLSNEKYKEFVLQNTN